MEYQADISIFRQYVLGVPTIQRKEIDKNFKKSYNGNVINKEWPVMEYQVDFSTFRQDTRRVKLRIK